MVFKLWSFDVLKTWIIGAFDHALQLYRDSPPSTLKLDFVELAYTNLEKCYFFEVSESTIGAQLHTISLKLPCIDGEIAVRHS